MCRDFQVEFLQIIVRNVLNVKESGLMCGSHAH